MKGLSEVSLPGLISASTEVTCTGFHFTLARQCNKHTDIYVQLLQELNLIQCEQKLLLIALNGPYWLLVISFSEVSQVPGILFLVGCFSFRRLKQGLCAELHPYPFLF